MSDVEQPTAPAPEAPAAEAPESFSTASEAAAFLARHAAAKRKSADTQDEGEAPAEATAEESDAEQSAEDAAPLEEAPGEETEEADPAKLPPIEPPRSWTKDEKDRFASLPRETQEYIAQREQERDREFRRSQNETAEQRKSIEAERQKAEQVRQQYEQQLPLVANAIQQAIMTEFPDIKTMDDVQRMAREDWPRYIQWDAKQKQLQQWQGEANAAQTRQKQEADAKLHQWRESQDKAFEDAVGSLPEAERAKLAGEAKNALIDYGLTEDQISELWNTSILRSSPLQRMMADAARYRLAKANAAKPAAKPVPPVQKPGNAMKAPNRTLETQIAALEAKPSLSLKEATDLVRLKGQRRTAA